MAPRVRGGYKRSRVDDYVILDGQRVGENPKFWATEKGLKDRPIVKEQMVNIKSISAVHEDFARVFGKFRARHWPKILTPTGKVYPRIVRFFYATMTLVPIQNMFIRSFRVTLDGTEYLITRERIYNILGFTPSQHITFPRCIWSSTSYLEQGKLKDFNCLMSWLWCFWLSQSKTQITGQKFPKEFIREREELKINQSSFDHKIDAELGFQRLPNYFVQERFWKKFLGETSRRVIVRIEEVSCETFGCRDPRQRPVVFLLSKEFPQESVLSIQNLAAENTINSVWNTTFELRDSVIIKRINLQQLRATEALEACILHLPVTSGTRENMDTLKKAICSAIDVMQTMASSICLLLSRAEGTNCLVSELANVTAQERALLDECGDLLASTAAVQVEEKSLRTHLMQLKQTLREEALFKGSACVILPSNASLTTTYKMSSYF
ncbi:hypothetical protein GIB67_011475 [Kingdonia uniflora]|uniref:Uncharacterized protein n=1 Tax=Kingdonia uniflora TaxID=39325 RepID=A0A7J7NM46_9MAGN|nr:hypothetical protein GIB67_011475 [Kingdonia uniflora]